MEENKVIPMNVKNLNERFIRWQFKTIDQMSYVSNLIIVLSTGSLGFIINYLINADNNSCYEKQLFTSGIFVLLISLTVGIISAINRLYDYRLTTTTIKLRKVKITTNVDQINELDFKINHLKDKTKNIGKRTWCLFKTQLITFIISIILFIIYFLIKYSNKLI